MNFPARQQGIGFFGVLMLLVLFAFIAVVALKLVPVYLESFKIDQALTAVIEDPNVAERSKQEIYETLLRRLDIDDVESIDFDNIRDRVKIDRDKGDVTITATYERRAPLFYNLTLLADFKKVVQN